MTTPADFIQAAATTALAAYTFTLGQPVGTYMYGSHVQASLEADSQPVPLIVLFDYTTDQKATTARVLRAACTMYFADTKPGQGDDPTVEMDTLLHMSSLKQKFLGELDKNALVEITNVRAAPFHDAYAARLTGIGVQFTLGVPAGSLACV